MIGVSVPVGAGKVLADYTALKNKTTGVTDSNSSQIAVGYTQDLSKRTILYTGYSQTKNDAKVALGGAGAAGKTDKLFTAGVRHSF